MNDKYTALFSLAPAGMTEAPADAYAVTLSAEGRVTEYRPGRAVPAPAPGTIVYAVPTQPVETLFAVHGAISCLKPDGSPFQPGFCFTLRLSYVSPAGLQKLLLAYRKEKSRLPECITLEVFYDLLSRDIRETCTKAAAAFSRGQTLPYVHWWQELNHGSAFRDALYLPLMQLFNSYGFRLEPDSLQMAGLAGVPAL